MVNIPMVGIIVFKLSVGVETTLPLLLSRKKNVIIFLFWKGKG